MDTITDFSTALGASDVLEFSLGPAFDSVGEVLAIATQVGNAVVFNFGQDNQLTLADTQLSSLGTDLFLFS
jgi:hypothetical protein